MRCSAELIVESSFFQEHFSSLAVLESSLFLVLQPAVELRYVNMFLSLVGGVGSVINDKQFPGEVSVPSSTCREGSATLSTSSLSLVPRPSVDLGGPRKRQWRGTQFSKKHGCPTCQVALHSKSTPGSLHYPRAMVNKSLTVPTCCFKSKISWVSCPLGTHPLQSEGIFVSLGPSLVAFL